jgi:hypothetical protein
MKALLAALVGLAIAAGALLMTSCGSFTGDGFTFPDVDLPIEIGVQYEIEPDLFIQVFPADKGGIEVKLVGEGQLSEHVRKIPGGFEIESSKTGLVYQITEGSNGKPRITITGGTGKLKPIPAVTPEK